MPYTYQHGEFSDMVDIFREKWIQIIIDWSERLLHIIYERARPIWIHSYMQQTSPHTRDFLCLCVWYSDSPHFRVCCFLHKFICKRLMNTNSINIYCMRVFNMHYYVFCQTEAIRFLFISSKVSKYFIHHALRNQIPPFLRKLLPQNV